MSAASKASRLTKALTLEEFRHALQTWLKPHPLGTVDGKVGLAVSGGVDSMALASLCTQLSRHRQQHRKKPFVPHAFVVDHGARPESTDESFRVVAELEKMGIPTRRLRLKWPDDVKDPSSLSNFEMQARKLRYQALGRACHEEQIRTLLLGHHLDDLAETMLMRISKAEGWASLRGPRPFSRIPHCEGIPGVDDIIYKDPATHLYTATRGITICRPFLDFPKARLEATCRETGTLWFEDPTNHDKSVTYRNTLRHLLANGRLPKALQRDRLVRLHGLVRRTMNALAGQAQAMVDALPLTADPNSATHSLRLQIPLKRRLSDVRQVDCDDVKRLLHSRAGGEFIRRLLLKVDPHLKLSGRQKEDARDRILQAIDRDRVTTGQTDWIVRFNVSHVYWQMRFLLSEKTGWQRHMAWAIHPFLSPRSQREHVATVFTKEAIDDKREPDWQLVPGNYSWMAIARWKPDISEFSPGERPKVAQALENGVIETRLIEKEEMRAFRKRIRNRRPLFDDYLTQTLRDQFPGKAKKVLLGFQLPGVDVGSRLIGLPMYGALIPELRKRLFWFKVPKHVEPELEND